MSSQVTLLPLAIIAGLVFGFDGLPSDLLVDYVFLRPGSRKQESEADYIGLCKTLSEQIVALRRATLLTSGSDDGGSML